MNFKHMKTTKREVEFLVATQNSTERTSAWCVETSPVPDCGGIGIAFVEQHIADNEREKDIDNLPYGFELIVAVIKQAVSDYEEALFEWLVNCRNTERLGESFTFLSDWSETLGVDIGWIENIMREEVYKKIKRKEKYKNAYRKTL